MFIKTRHNVYKLGDTKMEKNKFAQFLEENNISTTIFSRLSKIPEHMVIPWKNGDLPGWVNDIINSKEFITNLREYHERHPVSKYVDKIQVGQYLKRIPAYEGSLAALHPEVCEDWDYEKNGELRPEYFTESSQERVWWICKNGHSFQAAIRQRTRSSITMCPVCGVSNFVAPNNITLTYPSLMEEWNSEKNMLSSTQLTPGSVARVWWKCKYCSKEWEARVNTRVIQADTIGIGGCGKCCKLRMNMKTGKTLAKLFPEIASEWHPDLNKDLYITPEEISPGSNEMAWWKCKNSGHIWQSKVQTRTDSRRSGKCPQCFGVEKTYESHTGPADIINFLLVNNLSQVDFCKLLKISRKNMNPWLTEQKPIPDYIAERMIDAQELLNSSRKNIDLWLAGQTKIPAYGTNRIIEVQKTLDERK